MLFSARGVREDIPAESAVNAICKKYSRGEEIWEGAKWLLARSPGIGVEIRGTKGLRVYKTADWNVPGAVTIVLVYSFDNHHVTIHDVKAR